MIRFIALLGVRVHENVECSQRWENIMYRDRSRVEQQIMQNNVVSQNKHMYSLYIGSLCNVAFPMARFTCLVTSQVFVEI